MNLIIKLAPGLTQEVQGETDEPDQASDSNSHRCETVPQLLTTVNLTHSGVVQRSLQPLLQDVYQDIINEWPDASDSKRLQEYRYYCTNAEGFSPLIHSYLLRHLHRHTNLSPEKAVLLRPIDGHLDVRQRFNNLLLLFLLKPSCRSIFHCFLGSLWPGLECPGYPQ